MKDKSKEFSDINLKLNQLNTQLPRGAGPIQFNSNFGDTAALMLTVASPEGHADRSRAARHRHSQGHRANTRASSQGCVPQPRVSVIYAFPLSVAPGPVAQQLSKPSRTSPSATAR